MGAATFASRPKQRHAPSRLQPIVLIPPSQRINCHRTAKTGLICFPAKRPSPSTLKKLSRRNATPLHSRDSTVKISTKTSAISRFSCDVANRIRCRSFGFRNCNDPAGNSHGLLVAPRHLEMLLAKNIQAAASSPESRKPIRQLTSWPPHEHAAMLEEIYVYFDMPDPAYGIHSSTTTPESWLVTVVRDAMPLIPALSSQRFLPGHRICFLWAMAAHREVEDRQFES